LFFEDVQCYNMGGKVPEFINKWVLNQTYQESQHFAEVLATGTVPSMGPLAAD